MRAVNWNTSGNDRALTFWRQNVAQMWTDDEFPVAKDLSAWDSLTDNERDVYKKVLSGLTGLDTAQADDGMPLILLHTEDLRNKAVFSFMSMMEQIRNHIRIFTTLLPSSETDYLLNEWVTEQPHLMFKSSTLLYYYHALLQPNPSLTDRYMAHVASVFGESFLFYSGFYFPLYLAGQGKMTTSGEIIRKIILDETIHGLFTGFIAQELREKMSDDQRRYVDAEMYALLDELFDNEVAYTHEIYDKIGIAEDVIEYVKYNANRALQNLGFESYYEHEPVNPIVLNGLDTDTKNHDFFSVKGDGYVLALNVEDLRDEDFDFSDQNV